MLLVASLLVGAACSYAGNTSIRVRIIYSNDTIGYLEPCGCGGRYQGGLSRRATAIAQLTKENPNTVIIDSGNISTNFEKMGVIASIMSKMKYDAVGIGNYEMLHLEPFIKQAGKNGLQVIDSGAEKSKSSIPYLIKQVGGAKVGIISYGANCVGPERMLRGRRESFNSTYKTARRSSDILILLDQGGIATRAWLQGEAEQMGAPDIVIGGASYAKITKEEMIGKTHIMPTSTQGKQIGVIDVEIQPDRSLSMSAQMFLIDKKIAEDEVIKKQIDEYIKKTVFIITPEMLASLNAARSSKSAYTSPETCKRCHPDKYEQWSKTRHANAINTLAALERKVPDCLPCHSEEYRKTLKTTRPASMPTGIECATCHASVLPHG